MSHPSRRDTPCHAERVREGGDPSGPGAESRDGWHARTRVGRWLKKSFVLLVSAGLIVSFATGCDRLARHKVLTIFFTGVPSIEEQDRLQAEAREAAKKPQAVAAKPVVPKEKRGLVVKPTRFSHGPYAANQCYLCHEVSASGGFRGFGKQEEAAGSLAAAGIVPGKMVVPLNELCSGCHTSKSPAKAWQAGLWVHGPVSTGYCTICHGPHAGPERYMLLKAADAICVECHGEGQIYSQAAHQGRRDCTACHNAHVGKDSRLLKADYQEKW